MSLRKIFLVPRVPVGIHVGIVGVVHVVHVGIIISVSVDVGIGVRVGVRVGIRVGVGVEDGVGFGIGIGIGVGVGVRVVFILVPVCVRCWHVAIVVPVAISITFAFVLVLSFLFLVHSLAALVPIFAVTTVLDAVALGSTDCSITFFTPILSNVYPCNSLTVIHAGQTIAADGGHRMVLSIRHGASFRT